MADSPRLAALRILVEDDPRKSELRLQLAKELLKIGKDSDAKESIPHLQQAHRNPHIRQEALLLYQLTNLSGGMECFLSF